MSTTEPGGRRWSQLALVSLAELLAIGVWFSGSAIAPQLSQEWRLTASQVSWLTMSVQLGFVAGALGYGAVYPAVAPLAARGTLPATLPGWSGIEPWLVVSILMVIALVFFYALERGRRR